MNAGAFTPQVGEIIEIELDSGFGNENKLIISGIVRSIHADPTESDCGFGVEFGLFNLDEKDAARVLQIDA